MKKSIKKTSKAKTSYSKSSFSINWLVVALIIVLMAFGWYKYSSSPSLVAGVIDDYKYNTQKVVVTGTATGPKVTVVQQEAGDRTVGLNVKSDIEIAKNGAKLVEENAIKNAIKAGKTKEEAEKAGKVAAENSLHTSTAQIASGMASQTAINNKAPEEERAALAAYAYSAVEKSLKNTNLTELLSTGSTVSLNPTNPGGTTGTGNNSSSISNGSSCGGNESNIGDKQWAMLGDGTNKCVQCGGPRTDGKGGPGAWGQEKVECGTGDATNYVAPIYQSDKPKACWKDGTWFADTAGKVGNEHCLNGKWIERDQFIADKKKQCASLGSGYYYHEDHNACEKGSASPIVECGLGFEVKNGGCVSKNVPGQEAFQERECEKTLGMVYNDKNGLCEPSKVPLTKEQLVKAEIDHCKELQAERNKAGSTEWISCSDEGKVASQFCAKGFSVGGKNGCDLQPVNFGNQDSYASLDIIVGGNGFNASIGEDGLDMNRVVNARPIIDSALGCINGAVGSLTQGATSVIGGCTAGAANSFFSNPKDFGADVSVNVSNLVAPKSAPTQVGVLGTPDAPGQVGYDTVGAATGAVSMLGFTAVPCSIPLLVPIAGIPISLTCRAAAAGAGLVIGNKTGDYIYSWTHK